MSVLRGLAWPHLIPSRLESTPARSPAPSAVRDIVDRIENQNSRRRSSYGDQPETPPSRTLPSRPHLHSRASDPNLPTIPSAILSSRISSPSYVGPETILRRYTTVPLPGHKMTGSNVNQLSPRAPVRMSSEAEHTLPSLLPANSPLAVLEPNPFQDPFDDLIQSMPDAPIGGQTATPLAIPIPGGEKNDGILEVASSPHIEVVSPSREESQGGSLEQDPQTQAGHLDPSGKAVSLASKTPGFWSKRPAEILNNSSHSSRARRKKRKHNSKGRTKSPRTAVVSGSSQENSSSPFSDLAALPDTSGDYVGTSDYTSGEGSKISSPSYVTAHQTPLPPSEPTPQQILSYKGQKSHQTGPPLTRPPLRTLGKPQSTPILHMGKPNGVLDLSHTDDLASGLDGDQPPPCCDPPSNVPGPLCEALVVPLLNTPNDVENQQTGSETPTQPPEGYPFPAAPTGLVPAIPNPSNKPSALVPGISEIPARDLSRLPTPELPIKRKKANVVSRGMRQGRRIVLRSPILAVVLGRQLSKPTAVALKAIAKGLPLEEVSDAGGAAPTSVPVHV